MNGQIVKLIWNFVKGTGKVIGGGALLAMATVLGASIENKLHESKHVTYSDTVNAIMNSNMWSDDKAEAIAALSRDADEELYKAVVTVANGKMWANDKADLIIEGLLGKKA